MKFILKALLLCCMVVLGAGIAGGTSGCGSGGLYEECYLEYDPWCDCLEEVCYYKPGVPDEWKFETLPEGYEWVARDDGVPIGVQIDEHLERADDGRYKAVAPGCHLEWDMLAGDWAEVPDDPF